MEMGKGRFETSPRTSGAAKRLWTHSSPQAWGNGSRRRLRKTTRAKRQSGNLSGGEETGLEGWLLTESIYLSVPHVRTIFAAAAATATATTTTTYPGTKNTRTAVTFPTRVIGNPSSSGDGRSSVTASQAVHEPVVSAAREQMSVGLTMARVCRSCPMTGRS